MRTIVSMTAHAANAVHAPHPPWSPTGERQSPAGLPAARHEKAAGTAASAVPASDDSRAVPARGAAIASPQTAARGRTGICERRPQTGDMARVA